MAHLLFGDLPNRHRWFSIFGVKSPEDICRLIYLGMIRVDITPLYKLYIYINIICVWHIQFHDLTHRQPSFFDWRNQPIIEISNTLHSILEPSRARAFIQQASWMGLRNINHYLSRRDSHGRKKQQTINGRSSGSWNEGTVPYFVGIFPYIGLI